METVNTDKKDMLERLKGDQLTVKQLNINELAILSNISKLMELKSYYGFFAKYAIRIHEDNKLTDTQKQLILMADVVFYINENWGKALNEVKQLITSHKKISMEEMNEYTIDDLIDYCFELMEAVAPLRLLKVLGININDIKALFKFSDKDIEGVKNLIKPQNKAK
jgi:hypothetical protein